MPPRPCFRLRHTLSRRRQLRADALGRRPTHIPIIAEPRGTATRALAREQLLVPPDLTGAQLQYILRRQLSLSPQETLLVFCGNAVLRIDATMSTVAREHADPVDGLLYISFSFENAFGAL